MKRLWRPSQAQARFEIQFFRKIEGRALRTISSITGGRIERQVAPVLFVKGVEEFVTQTYVESEFRPHFPCILHVTEVLGF